MSLVLTQEDFLAFCFLLPASEGSEGKVFSWSVHIFGGGGGLPHLHPIILHLTYVLSRGYPSPRWEGGTLGLGYPPGWDRTGAPPWTGQDWGIPPEPGLLYPPPPARTGVPTLPPGQVTLGQVTPRAVRLLWFPAEGLSSCFFCLLSKLWPFEQFSILESLDKGPFTPSVSVNVESRLQ